MRERIYIVDMDDFCDLTVPELEVLEGCKKVYSDFKVTLFTIPARTSQFAIDHVRELNNRYGHSWILLAPHGWHHTRGECLAWTKEEAIDKINAAREMGIDTPCFRAPGWLLDKETYDACIELDYVVASHTDMRIVVPGAREYVYNDVRYRGKGTRAVHGHMTNVSGNYIRDLDAKGTLTFGGSQAPKFGWPNIEGVYVP